MATSSSTDAGDRPAVAVLGMGHMGQALAARLLSLSYPVHVWNRSERDLSGLCELGAQPLATLEGLWEVADVAVTFIANDEGLLSVCLGPNGILNEPARGALLIDMSTVSPKTSAEVARRAAAVNVDYLRSPVSGNPSVLASGALTLIVSGPEATFEGARDLLGDVGPTVLYVGDAEQSRLVKLAINAGLAITTELLAELILLTERYGLDRETFLDVLGKSVLGSPFIKYKTNGLNQRDYSATFTTALLGKDLRLALELAADAGLELPAMKLAATIVDAALDGYADVDFAALLPHLQRSHGHAPDIGPSLD